ncbi:MAG: hypothetical protein DMG89_21610 [Acidobacteria bacterium]|nr:MAG: hypothetical protein DMG89_21610 [Acidobacteriota bacterium]
MDWLGSLLPWLSAAMQIWILAVMWRRSLFARFPLFAAYIAFVTLRAIVGSLILSHQELYFFFYWITAPLEVVLTLLAAHESFMKVFGNFYLLWWFRFLFPSAIISALAYSGCTAYMHPPVNTSPAGVAIISAQIASQYIILGISVLFFSLVKFLNIRWRVHEYRFVLGFGISALGMAFAGALRSEFGTRFTFLNEMLPPVAYVIALLVWLSAVRETEVQAEPAADERPLPRELMQELRYHLRIVRTFLKKG